VPQGRCCLASSVRWVQVPSLPLLIPFKLRGEVEAVEMGTLEVSESRCESCRRDREANGLEAESKAACLGDRKEQERYLSARLLFHQSVSFRRAEVEAVEMRRSDR
jgi:hypothetical protein